MNEATWRKYLQDNPIVEAPSIIAQIGHLLRLRVIQEVELLTARLQARPQAACETPLVRRLTRAELSALRATGALPYEDVAAVIVLPPLNKATETGSRPAPNTTPLPDSSSAQSTSKLPLSELIPSCADGGIDLLPVEAGRRRTPLYNGVALFPSREQRAALHEGLSRLLAVERQSRFRQRARASSSDESRDAPRVKGHDKASHAFVIR